MCAHSRKFSLLGVPHVSKHLCVPLPGGAFTDYFSRAPRSLLPPVPEAKRLQQASGHSDVAKIWLALRQCMGVSGGLISPLCLLRVSVHLILARWGFLLDPGLWHSWLARFRLHWQPCAATMSLVVCSIGSVPVPGVANVLMDLAIVIKHTLSQQPQPAADASAQQLPQPPLPPAPPAAGEPLSPPRFCLPPPPPLAAHDDQHS